MNVPGGIESAAPLVEQQPEVRTGSNFRPLLGRRNQLDSMVEDGCQKSLLGAKRSEMRRLGRSLDMTAPFVFTVHRLVRDQTLKRRKRLERGLEELASTLLAHALDQRQRIETQASQYLAAIARAGAPADPLTFQDHDIRAPAGKLPSGGETRVACSDDHDVGPSGNWWGLVGALFEGSTSVGKLWTVPPIGVLLHIVPRDSSAAHVFDDRVAELGRTHLGRPSHQPREVVGDSATGDRAIHAVDNQVRGFRPAHVAEHHLCRQDH